MKKQSNQDKASEVNHPAGEMREGFTSGSEVNHPQETIADRLRAMIGSQNTAACARKWGIGDSLLRQYLGGSTPGVDKAAQIATAEGISLEWFATGGGSRYLTGPEAKALFAQDFVMVPRYDVHGSAGHGAVVHSEQIVDYLAFRADWVRNALGVAHKDLVLISVKGDSMEPSLSSGDLILVDTRANRVEDSAIYVLKNLDRLLVKRLQHKLDGTVVVKCDNERYDSETYTAEAASALAIVGRVVWAGRKL